MIDLNSATLWDLLRGRTKRDVSQGRAGIHPRRKARQRVAAEPHSRPTNKLDVPPKPSRGITADTKAGAEPAIDPAGLPKRISDRYRVMERSMLAEYGIRVRKWRSGMSGVAWQVTYRDGSVAKLIESPKPRGPVSASIFLHEVGHHAIGFSTYKPRCLEEYHAWMYSLEQMRRWELNISQPVLNRVHDSLHYAIAKASRRGLKRLPAELEPYLRPRTR